MVTRKIVKVAKLTEENRKATLSYLDDLLLILSKDELSDEDNINNLSEAYMAWLLEPPINYINAHQSNSAIKLQLVVSWKSKPH